MADLDDKRVRERFEEAATHFPHATVSLEQFAHAVERAVASGASLAELQTNDLFLALSCLAKDASSLAKLERDIILPLQPTIERVCRNGKTSADDVIQWTREKLLVSGGTGRDGVASPPKLTQYTGRGSLAGWIRVVATREALQDRRKSKHELTSMDAVSLLGGGPPAVSMEVALLRERYAASFRTAVEGALKALTPEQRSLLRFHTKDGLTIDQLAPMLGVHRATAARRLERARLDALEHTRRILRDSQGLSESEARSICTALGSEIDVSIARALSDGSVSTTS